MIVSPCDVTVSVYLCGSMIVLVLCVYACMILNECAGIYMILYQYMIACWCVSVYDWVLVSV